MRVGCALLCDAAAVREGLLFILGGGLNRVTYPTYPATLDLNLGLLIILESDEMEGDHELVVRIGLAGGQRLAQLTGRFVSHRPSPDAPEATVPIPVGINLPLPTPGEYVIEVTLDDQPAARLPLYATQGTEDITASPPEVAES
jgi:hypothetical protein